MSLIQSRTFTSINQGFKSSSILEQPVVPAESEINVFEELLADEKPVEAPVVDGPMVKQGSQDVSEFSGVEEAGPVGARSLFQVEFDKMIKSAEDACDALEPLESQILSLKVTGQTIPIGGSFPGIPLSDLLLFRDKSKVVYLQTRIFPLSDITPNYN